MTYAGWPTATAKLDPDRSPHTRHPVATAATTAGSSSTTIVMSRPRQSTPCRRASGPHGTGISEHERDPLRRVGRVDRQERRARLQTANCATTDSTDRGSASADNCSGPAPRPISNPASRFARWSNSAIGQLATSAAPRTTAAHPGFSLPGPGTTLATSPVARLGRCCSMW